ncbi:Rv3654c family TadE-like protein [Streptomyces sp. NPDC102279]|uniref:Rv3654c family TadE-like protein n=1 Tax=Streptomyces sp. NPDC102279 TaxID=3366153 RepID=UPI003800CB22
MSSDRGSATVWTVGAMAALCAVFGVVLAMGHAAVTRHRAAGAADLAALAAADHWSDGRVAACARADRVVRAQNARLVRCAVEGEISDVKAASGDGLFTSEARARAGPPGADAAGPPDADASASASPGEEPSGGVDASAWVEASRPPEAEASAGTDELKGAEALVASAVPVGFGRRAPSGPEGQASAGAEVPAGRKASTKSWSIPEREPEAARATGLPAWLESMRGTTLARRARP